MLRSLRRGCLELLHTPLYLWCIIGVPLLTAVFFMSLLSGGVAVQAPGAVVNLDHSAASRQLERSLSSLQMTSLKHRLNSYSEAIDMLQRGEIVGFVIIPEGFGRKAVTGGHPTLTYYINYSYFSAGSLLMKDYTKLTKIANGSLMQARLSATGMGKEQVRAMLQPYADQMHALSNPWIDYGVYLSNTFVPGVLALMILIITSYSLTLELKAHTSTQWLHTAGGSVIKAVTGKLLPQTVLFTLTGWAIQVMFYCLKGYPLHCPLWHMMLAMALLVVACQAFALLIACALPNLRFSVSVCSLLGMLSFSLAGFSYPVEQMYSWIKPVTAILPIRHYFLIYADQALNGLPLAYSARAIAALLAFTLAPALLLWRFKRKCQHPVYIP